jgi:hypothetical protein
MLKYEMPMPKAWLNTEAESHFDSCISQRQQGHDIFTHFTDVLWCSNPLLPPVLTGPLSSLSTRVSALWATIPVHKVKFYQLKCDLLDAFCYHLAMLSIFEDNRVKGRSALEGLQFYIRPASRNPADG